MSIEALWDVVDRRHLAAAREAVQALREGLDGVGASLDAARAACPVCSTLPDAVSSCSTARDPDALPDAAYTFVPAWLRRTDRCAEVVRCHGCDTAWHYRRDYEFLVGGTEDEEHLTRLQPAALLDRLDLDGTIPGWKRAAKDLALLEVALGQDLGEDVQRRRRALRRAIGAAVAGDSGGRAALDAEAAAEERLVEACPICGALADTEEPVPPLGRHLCPSGALGPTSCPTCGTAWDVELGADPDTRRLERRTLRRALDAGLDGERPSERLHRWLDRRRLDGQGAGLEARSVFG